AHPIPIDYVRQFTRLREIVKTGTEDIQLACKFIQCLGSAPQMGDEEVYELLRKLSERYAYEPSFQYRYAENLRFRDKYVELEALYRNLITNFPQQERAYLGLVPLLLRRDAPEEARKVLAGARRHQIPEGACQCMLGEILQHEGNLLAITAYTRSLREDTDYYSCVLDGLKETLKRFPEEAAAQADALRELMSTLHGEYKDWKVADILEALPGDRPTVELHLKIADQSPAPDLYSMLQQIAVLLDTWNRETRGTVFWQEQTRTHPESALRWVCLAGSFEREDNIQEAEQAYRRALEQDPNYTPALFKLGLLELDSGNSEHGTDLLVRATKADTAMAVFVADECSTRAAAFVDQEKMDKAADLYRVALQISPTDFWPQVYLGEIFENQGKNDAAREAYKQVLLQKPESPV
ncbi:MAG TPA: tetratricopeptide repeat protein, partial [Candidatus Hydrogenedentes bacterium]|nr:tetratricopeptide repeat protein [Candidatus Hydrogenedentota bacterium]